MQTAFYGKIKERRGEWLIGANKQNVAYLSMVATQHKIRQRCVRCLLISVKAHRRVRRVGAQTRINNY